MGTTASWFGRRLDMAATSRRTGESVDLGLVFDRIVDLSGDVRALDQKLDDHLAEHGRVASRTGALSGRVNAWLICAVAGALGMGGNVIAGMIEKGHL